MALTFTHNKKIQEIFKDEQCSGKLSIDSSKNIGENGKDGKNKSSLYFSNIEIDNSHNKETILKALDENVIISTNEKMSREYVIGDLIMTPKLDIFCVIESKNTNHKFDLEQYGKIINEERTEITDLQDAFLRVTLNNLDSCTRVCPAPVNRSMEAKSKQPRIFFYVNNNDNHSLPTLVEASLRNSYENYDEWRTVSGEYYTQKGHHDIADLVYNSSSLSESDRISIVSFYMPSQMVYNYYVSSIDSTSNFDSSSQFDTSLFIDYKNANRQMYGIIFKPNIYLQNLPNMIINLSDYEFTLRIGFKNKKKYGNDSSYSYYLGTSPTEAFSNPSPYDNNSIESDFFKNLYIPLNKIIDGSIDSSAEAFLSDVTMDRFHLFGNEYQSNIINTDMTENGRKCTFINNGTTYATRIFGSTIKNGTPVNILGVSTGENKKYVKSIFYLNDTYYHYPYDTSNETKANENGYIDTFYFIQRPIRKLELNNTNTINYRSGESAYFSSIVPNDNSGWCDDYPSAPLLSSKYNIYHNPNEIYEYQSQKLNKFDDYVLLSHLSNPNAYEASTNNNTPTYADIKTKASRQIGGIIFWEILIFLFNEENEHELICTNKKTQQAYYINLKNNNFKNKFGISNN